MPEQEIMGLEARVKAKRQAIREGREKIRLYWNNGEDLTGWEVFGWAGKMLEKLCLAKWVDGWGYYVEDGVVEALGESFTYQQAEEIVPVIARAVAAKKEAAKQAKRKTAMDDKELECWRNAETRYRKILYYVSELQLALASSNEHLGIIPCKFCEEYGKDRNCESCPWGKMMGCCRDMTSYCNDLGLALDEVEEMAQNMLQKIRYRVKAGETAGEEQP